MGPNGCRFVRGRRYGMTCVRAGPPIYPIGCDSVLADQRTLSVILYKDLQLPLLPGGGIRDTI